MTVSGTLDQAAEEDFRRIQQAVRSTIRLNHSPRRPLVGEVFPEPHDNMTGETQGAERGQTQAALQDFPHDQGENMDGTDESEADSDAGFVSMLSDTDAASYQSEFEGTELEGAAEREPEGPHLRDMLSTIVEEAEVVTPRAEKHGLDDEQREQASEGSGSSGSGPAAGWDPIDERALLIMTDPAFLGSTDVLHDRIASMSATRLTPQDGPPLSGIPQTPEVPRFLRRVQQDTGVQTPPVTSSPRTRGAHRLPSDTAPARRRGQRGQRVTTRTGRLSIEIELRINL